MRYVTNCVAPLFQFHPMWQKDSVAFLKRSNFGSLRLLMAHCLKLRLNWISRVFFIIFLLNLSMISWS